jgi:hypothetical protein
MFAIRWKYLVLASPFLNQVILGFCRVLLFLIAAKPRILLFKCLMRLLSLEDKCLISWATSRNYLSADHHCQLSMGQQIFGPRFKRLYCSVQLDMESNQVAELLRYFLVLGFLHNINETWHMRPV